MNKARPAGIKNNQRNFEFPKLGKNLNDNKLKNVLEKKVPEKYYLSQRYYEGLLAHKQRHAEKGSGFGCEIISLEGVSNRLPADGPCRLSYFRAED